jgi:hypothetical protein
MSIERDYGTGPTTSVNYFIGTEVESSPAKDMLTLFVVGIQPMDTLKRIIGDRSSYHDHSKYIRHVYLGANMSFHSVANDDYYTWRQIDGMIDELLDGTSIDYITVDITASQIEGFLESSASDNNRVIPMVSVKLPYLRLLNYNTTIKVDDKSFDATNPGVWCVPLENLTKRKYFTPWSAYKGDTPVNLNKEI